MHVIVLEHGRLFVEGVAGDQRNVLNSNALGVELRCKGMAESV